MHYYVRPFVQGIFIEERRAAGQDGIYLTRLLARARSPDVVKESNGEDGGQTRLKLRTRQIPHGD